MAQNTPNILQWLIKDEYKAIAEIKYEQKQLESRLNKYVQHEKEHALFSAEIDALCNTLSQKYLDYLQIIDASITRERIELPEPDRALTWQQQYALILHLKQQLYKTVHHQEECKILKEIASLYYYFNRLSHFPPTTANNAGEHSAVFKKIFRQDNLQMWLIAVVDFCNENNVQEAELSSLFHEWTSSQLQSALDFFASPKLVDLVNALFIYKLYPDKLFKELIHPEKLVSVRTRIGLLHHQIEILEQSLYNAALQQGLKPEVDYLFHGDELPQGIMIDVDEEFRELIQLAIKSVKVKYTHESEEQVTLERLYDLGLAYKFWFNPNRLIDAAMVLQQRLVKDDIAGENKLSVFSQKMVLLYGQLTTTECLDLYGYFANNDSRYLLYTLIAINKGQPLEWLPPLSLSEKNAIAQVLQALQCVMEALRNELKIRHVATEPYGYDLEKQHIHTGRRNRDAVFRIIAIYGSETIITNNRVEELFNLIEDRIRNSGG
ncbi:hypothetical protein [Legionella fallonii]|uniref:Uncharacterized protein n=1 Tax=Legionella fallonii LLAP-10 TaxID=1212491 RepID=A0A098G8E5_9GAMM|nr:hypothetical protein [Legionella fallonii]CEG58753.1 conserved protein of unknown function [Legionella fallonii LLAP-10]